MTVAVRDVRPGEAAVLDAYSMAVTAVAERLLPSVASLRVRGPAGTGLRGSGSAVVLDADGNCVTSAHVVAAGRSGTAAFADGTEAGFRVLGADALSDLAVLAVDGGARAPAELGDADGLRVGQLVVAIGNPLGFGGSVSAGVVSGLRRSLPTADGRHARFVEDVIQTDAALHPGNSGGALADSGGRVVGISTAVVGPGVGQGLGLAVPVNAHTRTIVESLRRLGRVRRAYLGLGGGGRPLPPRVAAATGQDRGVEVLSVVAGSPAALAGVRPEDLVVGLDDAPVRGVGDLQRLLDGGRVGQPTALRLARAGRLRTVEVVPTELPA